MSTALRLLPGTVSDETTYSTPGVVSDSNNIRYWKGQPETDAGFISFHDDLLTGVCRTVLAWTDNLGLGNVAFGTNSALMVIKSGLLYDITPAGLAAGQIDSVLYGGGWGSGGWGMGGWGVGQTQDLARTWSLATMDQALIASPAGGGIYIWENDVSLDATLVANAPTANGRVIVTSTRQICSIACVQVNGIYNPMCLRMSDPLDYEDWSPSTSDLAFEQNLIGGGVLVDVRNFGEGIIVWSDTSLFHAQSTGDPTQPWRFEKIADGCGLAGPQAAVVVNQTAYWLTPDLQFYAYQYGGSPTPLPCPISREFQETIDTTQLAKVVAGSVGKFQEVLWYYPDSETGEISRFVRAGVGDQALPWSKGDVPRTAYIDSGPLLYPLAVDFAGQAYLHENGTTANGETLSWFFETSPQYLGEGERRVLVRSIWPDFEAQEGAIALQFKTRNYPQADDKPKGPYTLAVGREKKDVRVEGRLISLRFSGGSGFMRLGKPTFDVVPTGER